MQRLARLAVYATAIVVVFTARLPDASTGSALRAASPDAILDPVRLLIATVLIIGTLFELLRRRPVWH
jgi:hypothetical protein